MRRGLHSLLAEEAHLLGQALQDSLDDESSRRLHELTVELDTYHDLLCHRPQLRPSDWPAPRRTDR